MQNGKVYQPTFKNSWGSGAMDDTYFLGGRGHGGGSQEDLFQELGVDRVPPFPGQRAQEGEELPAHHNYQLSYELALDNVLTPFVPPAPLVMSPLAKTSKKAFE